MSKYLIVILLFVSCSESKRKSKTNKQVIEHHIPMGLGNDNVENKKILIEQDFDSVDNMVYVRERDSVRVFMSGNSINIRYLKQLNNILDTVYEIDNIGVSYSKTNNYQSVDVMW
jgi:hypothetical protein